MVWYAAKTEITAQRRNSSHFLQLALELDEFDSRSADKNALINTGNSKRSAVFKYITNVFLPSDIVARAA